MRLQSRFKLILLRSNSQTLMPAGSIEAAACLDKLLCVQMTQRSHLLYAAESISRHSLVNRPCKEWAALRASAGCVSVVRYHFLPPTPSLVTLPKVFQKTHNATVPKPLWATPPATPTQISCLHRLSYCCRSSGKSPSSVTLSLVKQQNVVVKFLTTETFNTGNKALLLWPPAADQLTGFEETNDLDTLQTPLAETKADFLFSFSLLA